jgi:hypothetical protein
MAHAWHTSADLFSEAQQFLRTPTDIAKRVSFRRGSPPLGAVKVLQGLQSSALLAEAPQAVTAASLAHLLSLQETPAAPAAAGWVVTT